MLGYAKAPAPPGHRTGTVVWRHQMPVKMPPPINANPVEELFLPGSVSQESAFLQLDHVRVDGADSLP